MNIRMRIRRHFQTILATKTSPHSIAFGFALGTFLALLPTPGLSIVFAIMLLLILRNASKYSTFIALGIFNPFVTAPFYVMSYTIGGLLFGHDHTIKYNIVIVDQIYQFTKSFLVGNLILSTSVAMISYIFVYLTVFIVQNRDVLIRLLKNRKTDK